MLCSRRRVGVADVHRGIGRETLAQIATSGTTQFRTGNARGIHQAGGLNLPRHTRRDHHLIEGILFAPFVEGDAQRTAQILYHDGIGDIAYIAHHQLPHRGERGQRERAVFRGQRSALRGTPYDVRPHDRIAGRSSYLSRHLPLRLGRGLRHEGTERQAEDCCIEGSIERIRYIYGHIIVLIYRGGAKIWSFRNTFCTQ